MYSRLSIKKLFFLVLISSIGINSCNTRPKIQPGDITKEDVIRKDLSTASKSDSNITEKYWKLVELYGQKITPSENRKREAHFILKEKDKRVIGNGGCNSFTGAYELSGINGIRFSKIASTMMACINTSDMETEVQFFRALESVDNYYVDGDRLQLNRARMAPIAQFEIVYLK